MVRADQLSPPPSSPVEIRTSRMTVLAASGVLPGTVTVAVAPGVSEGELVLLTVGNADGSSRSLSDQIMATTEPTVVTTTTTVMKTTAAV